MGQWAAAPQLPLLSCLMVYEERVMNSSGSGSRSLRIAQPDRCNKLDTRTKSQADSSQRPCLQSGATAACDPFPAVAEEVTGCAGTALRARLLRGWL